MAARRYAFFSALLAAALLLGACNMPRRGQTPVSRDALYTQAALTVIAQTTLVAQPPATQAGPALAPTAILPPGTLTPIPTYTPGPTSPPAATATPVPCDRARFVRDVTIPDDTQLRPGEAFVKTWRIRNAGSCTWNTAYALVFAGGEIMGAPASLPLPRNVAPGEEIDLSVNLVAPTSAGAYRGNYMLRNASNSPFGLGDGSKPFWVQVRVVTPKQVAFDFLAQAQYAEWVSAVRDNPGAALPFGGADDDPNGAAKIKDRIRLETGLTSGRILLTFPRHDPEGVLSGLFPSYTVQSGDRLRGTLGFWTPGSSCHNGKVIFQINYLEGSELKMLQQWPKTCSGDLTSIDLNLSSLVGKSVRFALVVIADGAFQDDWAVWNSLRIDR
jgi:hypothetical protein